MYEQVMKPKENKSPEVVNSITQKKSNEKASFEFVDNRQESIQMRKAQDTIDPVVNTEKVTQLNRDKGGRRGKKNRRKKEHDLKKQKGSTDVYEERLEAKLKAQRKKGYHERSTRKQAGKSAGPIDVLGESVTTNPFSSREIEKFPMKGEINPSRVRTAQSGAQEHFSDGRSIASTAHELRNPKDDTDVPGIKVVESGGELYSLDHRRLVAYRKSGKLAPYEMSDNEKDLLRKKSTKDNGMSMKIVASERIPMSGYDMTDLSDHGEEEEDFFEDEYEMEDESQDMEDFSDDYDSI
ncbi:hypothetical protein [Tenacibaculum halocynthiae]|uniref:hypothetical protein n=1 Tax=Tenacibaculum halocynthiae TaxID=1254437 RepID=UPI0038952C5F